MLEAEKRDDDELEKDNSFLDKQVLVATIDLIPFFADFANYLVNDIMPEDLSFQQKKKFLHDVRKYFWDESYLFSLYADNLIRRCVMEVEMSSILEACYFSPIGGHLGGACTVQKVLQYGY